MKNDLSTLVLRFIELKSQFKHGYTGEMLLENVIGVITDEILSELGEIERCDEIRDALTNMFYLGKYANKILD